LDAIGPNLPGCPLEYEERVGLLMELDPDSLVYEYITWLEETVATAIEKNEELSRENNNIRRYLRRREP
jgi:hypothetical protein